MKRLFPVITVILFFAGAAPARADVTLTPFVGGLFGGNLSKNKPAYGFSIAAMGKGIIGGEFDVSWTPSFVEASADHNAVTEANLSGNLIIGIPIGGTTGGSFRPYVLGGVGLVRASEKKSDLVANRISTNDFAWDIGGGAIGMFNTHIGVRGDVRYFRSNESSGGFNFWRGTGGLAFKF